MHQFSLDDVEAFARDTLLRAGASPDAAAAVARSTRLAERDGIRSHGLLYVPIYPEHLVCGKASTTAYPTVEQTRQGTIRVNADAGFAHTAIDAGWSAFIAAARETGIAAMSLPFAQIEPRTLVKSHDLSAEVLA